MRSIYGLFGVLFAQGSFIAGNVHVYRSFISCAADERVGSYQDISPTYNAAFFIQGGYAWNPYVATGIEVGYGGQAQKYYGTGITGKPYTAKITYSYIRPSVFIEGRYAWAEKTAGWIQTGLGYTLPVSANELYQGDSVPSGSLYRAQLTQKLLQYLEESDDPTERRLLLQVYKKAFWEFFIRGGVDVNLTENLVLRAGVFYMRSLQDIENKNLKLGESLFYDAQRAPTKAVQVGMLWGLIYSFP